MIFKDNLIKAKDHLVSGEVLKFTGTRAKESLKPKSLLALIFQDITNRRTILLITKKVLLSLTKYIL